jgi:hypothetical protein
MRRIRWWAASISVLVAALFSVAVPRAYAGGSQSSGPADAVLDWNAYSAQAIVAGRPPASSAVLLGIVHVAIYDTAVALGLDAEPYLRRDRAPRRTSARAAIATSAYLVLIARVPAQKPFLDSAYEQYLAAVPDGRAKQDGVDLGTRVAARVLEWRAGDGFDVSVPYVQTPPGPGVWEPTAPTPPVDIVLSQVRPLALRAIDQLRPAGPDELTSTRYAEDLAEVKRLGRVDSADRTSEQTEIARFWADHGTAQWNRAVRQIAIGQGLNLGEAARLFAMVFVSAADADIACMDAKYHYRFWRPVHAITRADTDDNPATEADPTWQSLLNVNHPEYPSGHGCHTGAITVALAAYFGHDQFQYTVDSTVTGATRSYDSFSAALDEVLEARIWAGLHFRHSMNDGARIGRRAARWVVNHHFQA